jgi:hypothetical protein
MDAISGDRRGRRRYDLQLPLMYRCLSEGKLILTGAGRTLDISTQGIRFVAGAALPKASRVEVMINWPVLSLSGKPIVLMAFGTVVRVTDQYAGIRVAHYEFLSDVEAPTLPADSTPVRGSGTSNRVQIYELRRSLCELLRRVETGDVLLVYRRNVPIAEIRPAGQNRLPPTGTV